MAAINDATKRFGKENQFELNVSGGFQAIATRSDSVGATGQGFVTNAANVIANASTTSASQQRNDVRQYGYLGQLGLAYRDRIFLQAGARVDDFSALVKAPTRSSFQRSGSHGSCPMSVGSRWPVSSHRSAPV